ncbi:efflux RND transporter periplasmic adaptor subunit [Rhizobium sp. TRM96647]|uniref:efflux RND transporter periplasmic adaptor subunit n=1 Tax=unclassified Rhizobium TaxID=2613769 RepID=UPI0021E92910|nr:MULTISPECIES: efflux RND transporter periplasmic adaptor subunit [unclassified Rhizobium]MCV3736172.1 efflux RND transporter periplasmic adaptor subunit [Rhizobium sp. TRM96647]MCV3758166.1 efflux RND transporter periplasmic adaptor subunit [Rhizobium sp. TRM96650]
MGVVLLWLAFISTSQAAEEQMPVTVVVARQGAVTETVPVVGSLAAREEVQVHPLVQGRAIEHILVEVGQTVDKGQPLALLDTTDARLSLDRNAVGILRAEAAVRVEESRLDVAKVSEAEARKVLERSRALQPKGAVSQQVLDEHENAHARAVAELGLALQSLKLAEADAQIVARERDEIELAIERSTVRAPEGGLVLRRTARVGMMVSGSGGPLFVLAKDAAIEFVAQVTETSFVRLAEGMHATITQPGYEGPLGGTVRLNAAELDPATRSGEVRVELDDVAGLRPGVFARGSINALARRNILLPGSAVKTAGGASNVFVVEDGVVDLRQVTVGVRQDGFVEILDGLRDGEMVVLKSGGFLKAEEKVRPVIAASALPSTDHLAASLAIGKVEAAR